MNIETPTLPFDGTDMLNTSVPVAVPAFPNFAQPRQAVIDAAHDAAHEAWKEAFPQFVIEFAAKATEPFTGESLREAYELTDLPQTDKWQAAGKVYQRLVKERKLHPAGMARSRRYGNFLQLYTKY